MKVTGYLVVRGDGTMRLTKRRVRLAFDEVAFPVSVTIPDTWGRIQSSRIDLTMPSAPEAVVTSGEVESDNQGTEDG